MDSTQRVAVVTGAASGIGRATAAALAREGIAVVVADLDETEGKETVTQIQEAGGDAALHVTNVADEAEVDALFDAVISDFGRLDVAVNNAGFTGDMGVSHECSLAEWERVMGVNLTGTFLCMRREIALMLADAGGSVVNVSSAAGLIGFPGLPAYSASKSGVIGLTRAWALDYARQGVRINAVCPGGVDTPMIRGFVGGNEEMLGAIADAQPMGRLADPEEIATAVCWLASDSSSYVTGHALSVDGGTVIG